MSRLSFEFERRRLGMEEVRDLIYNEVLEYHPTVQAQYASVRPPAYHYPSPVDAVRQRMIHLEAGGAGPHVSKATSMPKEVVDAARVRQAMGPAAVRDMVAQQQPYLHPPAANGPVARSESGPSKVAQGG